MVSKCANPRCSATFHYLRDGKVFQLQVETGKPAAHMEHFWLCGRCASMLTLLVDHGKVVAVPLDQGRWRRAAAS